MLVIIRAVDFILPTFTLTDFAQKFDLHTPYYCFLLKHANNTIPSYDFYLKFYDLLDLSETNTSI